MMSSISEGDVKNAGHAGGIVVLTARRARAAGLPF